MTKLVALLSISLAGLVLAVGCGADSDPTPAADDAGVPTTTSTPNPNDSQAFPVGGTVTGLLGTGMVLQNNGGDDIAVNANGAFVFPAKIGSGKPFSVTVKAQPSAPSQKCTVTGGSGVIATGAVTSVVVNCTTNGFTVGGQVTGLAGTGLVLQNNGGDDIVVGATGAFAFSKALPDKTAYKVTIKTQPTNLAQTCTVTNDSGTVSGANVTNVAVSCVTKKFTVGGTVTGLVGTGLVVRNNGGGDLPINGNGSFTFAASQDDGTDFAVTVKTDPTGPEQTCLVAGGKGKLAGGNVTSVTVNCSTKKYAIGGTVSGLAGAGLVLQDNAGDDLAVNANGEFAFATPLEDLAAYAVTVKTQPTNKWQTCTVANGSGNVAQAAVTSIAVVCTTNAYKVKATVSGLAGSGLVVQNNAGDDLAIAANGTYEFATPVASGAGYLVTVLKNPENKSQTCTVTNGAGMMAGADVTNVTIACTTNKYTVGGTISGLAAGNDVVLQNNLGDDLTRAANGAFSFATGIESGQTYSVTVKTQPSTPNQTCVVTGGSGTVVAGNIPSIDVNCTTNKYTVSGTISGLAGTGLQLKNSNGDVVVVNGTSFSFPAQDDGSAYAITVDTQPVSPWQTCTVANGAGAINGANVTGVTVSCTTNKYTVGGTVTGLVGTVVLTNNGGDDKTINADGAFAFATSIASGAPYSVAIKTQPGGKTRCTLTNASGNVGGSAITNVTVTCKTCTGSLVNGFCWINSKVCETTQQACSSIGLTGRNVFLPMTWDMTAMQSIATDLGLTAGGVNGCCVQFAWIQNNTIYTHNFGSQYYNWDNCPVGYPTLKACDMP